MNNLRILSNLSSLRRVPVSSSCLLKFRKMHLTSVGQVPVSFASQDLQQKEARSRTRRKKQEPKVSEDIDSTTVMSNTETEVTETAGRRRNAKRKATKIVQVEETRGNPDELEESPATKKPKRKAGTKTKANGAPDDEYQDKEQSPKKKRRRKTPEEDKVYEIPPIEKMLTTSFKGMYYIIPIISTNKTKAALISGRLGYACLNTVLRNYSTPIFCSRTRRLSTLAELGHEHLQSLGLQNIRDLLTLVKWNAENGIFFMRMSSEMFPFASHPIHGYDLSFADKDLKAIGKASKELGVRLTTHPGQFTQLGSPRENVVENAFRDLKCK